jgi:succinoglycan biosynthesis transport protein ExoP
MDIRRPSEERHLLASDPSRTPAAPLIGILPETMPSSEAMTDSLLVVIGRNRWTICICVVAALTVGLVYIQTVTPIYTSTSRLCLDYVNIVPPSSEPGRTPQIERYLQTQAGWLQSRPIVTSALSTLDGLHLRTFHDVVDPVRFVSKKMRVTVGKREDIISIAFDSPYPLEAAQIANEIVEAYTVSRSKQTQKNAKQVLEIMQGDLDRVGKERVQKQTELEEFRTNRMPLALGSEAGGTVIQRHLEDLQAELTRAQTTRMEAESFHNAVKALSSDSGALRRYMQAKNSVSSRFDATTEWSPLETRLMELDLQAGELSSRNKLSTQHPSVATLKEQRTAIEAKLREADDRFVSTVIAAAEQLYHEASDHEEQLAASYAKQREQMVALSAEVAEYQWLRAEIDRLTTYEHTLAEQVGEIARIANEDVGQLRMVILEPAFQAADPSSPQKGKVMAVALMLGLLLGGGIAVVRDWLDQTLHSPEEVSVQLGLRVLGAIPAMSHRQTVQQRGRKVLVEPESHEAEAFRTVRTAVFFGAPKGQVKTILVTSPMAGDGKSTLVSNLAITMAQAGQKTLVIDADFRKPVQDAIFGLDHHERCLRNVLAAKKKLAAAIQPTEVRGLHLLTSGRGIANPTEVLNSPRFALLLKNLAAFYDRVLVDAPPVTVVTDAQILGALCDATLLVLKAEKSTSRMARRAIIALRSVGAQMLGIVVNDVPKPGDHCGYYYGRYGRRDDADSGNGTHGKPRRTHTTTNETSAEGLRETVRIQ